MATSREGTYLWERGIDMESRQQGAGCFGCLWLLIGLGLVLSDLGILFPTIPTHRSLGTGERLLLDAIFIVGVPMYISFIGAMVTVKNWGGRIFAGILASLVCAGILFAESAIPSPHTFVARASPIPVGICSVSRCFPVSSLPSSSLPWPLWSLPFGRRQNPSQYCVQEPRNC